MPKLRDKFLIEYGGYYNTKQFIYRSISMVLPQLKKQIATFVCISLISCSFIYPMQGHKRTPAIASSSVTFNCSPCCDKNAGNNTPPATKPTLVIPQPSSASLPSSDDAQLPSNVVDLRLTSSSFANATFEEDEQEQKTKVANAMSQKPNIDDQFDRLAEQDSCLQNSVNTISGKIYKYKINYFLGALELLSAGISIYNIAANTNPEPEWEHVINTTAAITCIQAGLAQVTAGTINKLTGKNHQSAQAKDKNAAPQPNRLQQVGDFCYNNAGYITAGLGVTVAVTNLAFPGDTPAAVNGLDAAVSLTGAGACAVAESLSKAKAKIEADQKAERERRHGKQESVELRGRKITFSTPTTRTPAGSQATTARTAEPSVTDLEV